jgi:tRNA (guanine-N7-)-methyltransferase
MTHHRRRENTTSPIELKAGDVEYEMGVPFPGTILSPENWVQTALKHLPESGPLDLAKLFGRQAPIALEIGCGNGRFTISSAFRRREWDHLAIDILPTVVRYATRRANQRGLSNVRVAVCDGWRFLSQMLSTGTIHEVHIYHPQPYADPAQSAKRMLTPDFLALLYQALVDGGKLFLQTDRQPYWDYIRLVMPALFDWQELNEPWPEDPSGRSRREMLSISQGLTVFRGVATRSQQYDGNEVEQIVKSLPLPEFKIAPANRFAYRRKSRKGRQKKK